MEPLKSGFHCYGHSRPTADSSRAVVNCQQKCVILQVKILSNLSISVKSLSGLTEHARHDLNSVYRV